jgi:hypothetical protein
VKRDDLSIFARATSLFHSARQDLEIIWLLGGLLPQPFFDTQVAAMVCGYQRINERGRAVRRRDLDQAQLRVVGRLAHELRVDGHGGVASASRSPIRSSIAGAHEADHLDGRTRRRLRAPGLARHGNGAGAGSHDLGSEDL